MKTKVTKTEFCSGFAWPHLPSLTWFDKTGFARLGDGLIARVELYEGSGVSGHYTGMLVRILNRKEGEVDRKFFLFDDYLPLGGRKDTRADYLGSDGHTFKVLSHIGWSWYIAVPTSTRPLCEAIAKYIEVFS